MLHSVSKDLKYPFVYSTIFNRIPPMDTDVNQADESSILTYLVCLISKINNKKIGYLLVTNSVNERMA